MPSVLLVEDDPAIAEVLTWALVERGYQVQEAPTGRQALEHLGSSEEPLIVLLDEVLPDLDGLSLLRLVGAHPKLAATHAFILMSALPAALLTHPQAVPAAVPVSFLPKPFVLTQLWRVLATATGRIERPPVIPS